jgi:hypothetical protein
MRLTIEPWAPEYGAPFEADVLTPSDAHVDPDVELPSALWQPLDPDAATRPAACVQFVDGVRRIDARVWITSDNGTARIGICASYAAGLTRCERSAEIQHVAVRRGLFGPADAPALETRVGCYAPMAVAGDDPEQLSLGIQQRMGELETLVASESGRGPAEADALIVLDGPLTGRQNIPGAIGYVKTHRVAYLPPAISEVVTRLNPGQRTPIFVTQTSWSRFSWYIRLPGPAGHPWAGIIRCEASADQRLERVRLLADQCTRTLPRFASAPHKDPRAPQNLYPIAGLERELRRRLGDPAWIYRALRIAVGVPK